jgi:prepilin-type N-terminal cleavage/methylation domain-containing protein/prepilin-type processing-associated H-X9-DG protein
MPHGCRLPRPPRARGGFTLVEMLVVIGIVVVLAAILVPVVNSARQRARVVQCTTNLQQIGVAIAAYVNDYQRLPLVYYHQGVFGVDAAAERMWSRPPSPPPDHDARMVLGDYVSDKSIFECPVVAAVPERSRWAVIVLPDAALYSYNGDMSGWRLSQILCGPARALTMSDPIDPPSELFLPQHGDKYNALFLDGHVKAYDQILGGGPERGDPWPPD